MMAKIDLHIGLTYDQIWNRVEAVTDEIMIDEQYKTILLLDKYGNENMESDDYHGGDRYNTYKYYTDKQDLINKLYEVIKDL